MALDDATGVGELMLNRNRKKPKELMDRARRICSGRRGLIAGAAVIALTLSSAAILGKRAELLTSTSPSTPQSSGISPSAPSKEYIYAGGRLVATEEPVQVTLSAPTSLMATALSTAQVSVAWIGSGGPVHHYELQRSQSFSGTYTTLSPNPVTTSFTDLTVTGLVAYLYRVRAVDAQGNMSSFSNIDLATTISFTDDPLIAGVTVIRAQHINELRVAVNAVRTTAGLTTVDGTNSPVAGLTIRAAHVSELRSNLDQALAAMQFGSPPYKDSPLAAGITVKKVHIEELRQGVR